MRRRRLQSVAIITVKRGVVNHFGMWRTRTEDHLRKTNDHMIIF